MAAECWDGIPEHGQYAELLRQASSPQALLEMILSSPPAQDHWQVQIQAQVQSKAEVYLYSHNLSEAQVREALLEPCGEIRSGWKRWWRRSGRGRGYACLPEGPMTIPYLKN